MLSMYRFMSRKSGGGELEPIVRYQKIDFPDSGPKTATAQQKTALAKAVADAVAQEARYGQVVLATRATTGGIVAVESLSKRGTPDSLVWLDA
jgi:hypothetical protein